jgi:methylglutaconyl-CoA hydratase
MIEIDRHLHPGVVTLRINRPEKRNALDARVARALTAAVIEADEDDETRVIVLTGEGRAFSAGADLAALQSLADASFEDNLEDSQTLATLFETIYQTNKPVVARVNGHAIAGGCGLVAVCDFAIAEDGPLFGFTEVRIGFVPAIISVYLLERHPAQRVRQAFLTGETFGSARAHEMGILSQVAGPGGLDAAVRDLVGRLGRETSGAAFAATKQLLRARHALDHQKRLSAAIELNARARSAPECRAGVAAFLAKSPMPWVESWDAKEDAAP